jgi:hypothetical protein
MGYRMDQNSLSAPMDTMQDLANFLKLSVVCVRGWVRRGIIPHNTYIRVAGTYRFDRAAVVRALQNATPVADPIDTADASPFQLNLFDEEENTNQPGESQ